MVAWVLAGSARAPCRNGCSEGLRKQGLHRPGRVRGSHSYRVMVIDVHGSFVGAHGALVQG